LLAEVEQGFAAISPQERAALNDAWLGRALPSALNDKLLYGLMLVLGLAALLAGVALVLRQAIKQRTAQLTVAKAQLEATLAAIPDPLFEVDREGRYLGVSTQHPELLAAPIATLLGRTLAEVLPREAAAICHAALDEARATGFSFGRTIRLETPAGLRWFELSVSRKQQSESRFSFIILSRDITARIEAEQKLERMTRLYDALSQCNQAIVRCQNEDQLLPIICRDAVTRGGFKMAWVGRIDEVQQRVVPVARYGEGHEYLDGIEISILPDQPTGQGPVGRAIRSNTPCWCQDFQNDPITTPWHERGKQFGWGSSAALPLTCNGKVVGTFNVYESKTNAFDEAERNLLVEMALDISFALERFAHERASAEAARTIEHLANFDALTALPNRALLQDRAHQAFANASRSGQHVAVMFLDLDHFKNINDSLGHAVGDQLLCAVAARLQASVREQDTVARWGGDEFVLLLPDTTATGATRIAEKLMAALSAPYRLDHHDLNRTSSIGIALYPADGSDFEALAKAADTAMFRAKQQGRNAFSFFTAELEARSRRFLEVENALRQALRRNEFFLHYQPQIALADARVTGAEALLRWQHPVLGLISPAEFIPIAEASGQILDLGDWVLREATRQAKAWQDAGLPPLTVAVNLSTAQFHHRHLAEQVRDLLAATGLPPHRLEFEITESLAMENPQAAIETIDAMHAQGVAFSIDDFGTGYSSLAYLKRFKVSKLKIDQSFVRDIASDEDDRAIVATIIALAQHLGFTTIAEGVETQEQLDYLRLHGCEKVQGYFFSRPLLADEFEAFVRARNGV
jgi:diguanylate cyclase (GGDEF)-like protein/PAS domain S-box-containing protein